MPIRWPVGHPLHRPEQDDDLLDDDCGCGNRTTATTARSLLHLHLPQHSSNISNIAAAAAAATTNFNNNNGSESISNNQNSTNISSRIGNGVYGVHYNDECSDRCRISEEADGNAVWEGEENADPRNKSHQKKEDYDGDQEHSSIASSLTSLPEDHPRRVSDLSVDEGCWRQQHQEQEGTVVTTATHPTVVTRTNSADSQGSSYDDRRSCQFCGREGQAGEDDEVLDDNSLLLLSPLTPVGSPERREMLETPREEQPCCRRHRRHHPRRRRRRLSRKDEEEQHSPHETVHAQSLLLGLAFLCIWSPNNMMAPNLTEMAQTFRFDDAERDLYLGSYAALATGVLSFPIGAGLGILADFCSRRKLYCLAVAGSGLSAAAVAWSARTGSYWQLISARLIQGGFMSGSVPVAFSFLGDMFSAEERNAASSGLTAMMGLGIAVGQVYAGMVGTSRGWDFPFYVSAVACFVSALLCLQFVREPIRGGKERVLQDMIRAGTRYERQLDWNAFVHAMRHNPSNGIILWQGFFSSLPWGIVFVFLNDYLSQERGFSVPDATYIVLVFGLGCAAGGILGGYWGQKLLNRKRSWLPLFMAATTAAGILPFLCLLNGQFTDAHGWQAHLCSWMAGMVASLPAVNVRPCLINVNPPETRGASLTAANLLIQLGRGVGPSCVTAMVSASSWLRWRSSIGDPTPFDRRSAFNVTLVVFWLISAIQLCFLAKTLPKDQDDMERELARYAEEAIASARRPRLRRRQQHAISLRSMRFVKSGGVADSASDEENGAALPSDPANSGVNTPPVEADRRDSTNTGIDDAGSVSIVSIEERMTSFDQTAAQQTIRYVAVGIKELKEEIRRKPAGAFLLSCGGGDSSSSAGAESTEEDVSGGCSSNDSCCDCSSQSEGYGEAQQNLGDEQDDRKTPQQHRHQNLAAPRTTATSLATSEQPCKDEDSFPTENTPLVAAAVQYDKA